MIIKNFEMNLGQYFWSGPFDFFYPSFAAILLFLLLTKQSKTQKESHFRDEMLGKLM